MDAISNLLLGTCQAINFGSEASDYTLGEEFRVDAPAGSAAAVWSLEVTRGEDCTLYLIGVPGRLSQKPDGLLAPRDARP